MKTRGEANDWMPDTSVCRDTIPPQIWIFGPCGYMTSWCNHKNNFVKIPVLMQQLNTKRHPHKRRANGCLRHQKLMQQRTLQISEALVRFSFAQRNGDAVITGRAVCQ